MACQDKGYKKVNFWLKVLFLAMRKANMSTMGKTLTSLLGDLSDCIMSLWSEKHGLGWRS